MHKNYYIFSNGRLERKDNTVQFISADGNKRALPIEQMEGLYLMGEIDVNSKCINFLGSKGIFLHFFNYYDFYTGSFVPRLRQLSGRMLVKQVSMYTNESERLKLAKSFVLGSMENMYRNLRYYNSRGRDLDASMNMIKAMEKDLPGAKTVAEVMGYEGIARKAYYEAWPSIINQEIDFDKRVMHPPDTMINSLISFVNMMIYTRVLSEIYKTSLNSTISFLHEPGERRHSLSLDLAEIFKPLLGDRLLFKVLNKKQITPKSFTPGLNYLHLKKEAVQLLCTELDNRMKETIEHKDLGKSVSYQYLIRLECYKLYKHILGEKEYVPFTMKW